MELHREDSHGADLAKRLADVERDQFSPETESAAPIHEDHVSFESEAVVDSWGPGAEAVPVTLGGALSSAETLARRASVVFGHDPSLAMKAIVLPTGAAFSVWNGGTPEQQLFLADLLLSGQAVGTGHFRVGEVGRPWMVREVAGYEGARAIVMYDDSTRELRLWRDPSKDHPSGRRTRRLVGLRAFPIEDLTFDAAPRFLDVTAGVIRSHATARTVAAAASTGILDSALLLCRRYVRARRLYGDPIIAIPHARHALAVAEALRLLCEAMAGAATRAVHLVPRESECISSLASEALLVATSRGLGTLAMLFSSTFYARIAPYQKFEKLYRDHRVLTSRMLARTDGCPFPCDPFNSAAPMDIRPAIFQFGGELPPLSFGPSVDASTRSGSLLAPLESNDLLERLGDLDAAAASTVAELRRALSRTRSDVLSSSAVERYRRVLAWCAAAGASLGVWAADERSMGSSVSLLRLRATLSVASALVSNAPVRLADDLVESLTTSRSRLPGGTHADAQ